MMGWYHLLDNLLSIHAVMGEQVWWPIDVIYNHGFLVFQLEKKTCLCRWAYYSGVTASTKYRYCAFFLFFHRLCIYLLVEIKMFL